MKILKVCPAVILSLILMSGCSDKNPTNSSSGLSNITSTQVTLNPNYFAPLTASIKVESKIPVTVTVTVKGKHGSDSDVVQKFDQASTDQDIPILGLYPDFNNTVTLSFYDTGTELGTKKFDIQTDPLIPDMPSITINNAKRTQMTKGMTLVSYFGYNKDTFPQRPFMFDSYGDIRWYLNFSGSPVIPQLFFDCGVERLQNGDLYFGDINDSPSRIYEYDMMGKFVDSWEMPGYTFHHNVVEEPNGNFLVTATKDGDNTVEDRIIEIDHTSKQIIDTWNLKQSLDYNRTTLTGNRVDWIHINDVFYDESDNTIIVSGRTQGVVKLTRDNKVVWILGPHRGWGTSGDGVELNKYLLQPLDSNDQPITDQSVLNGDKNSPGFGWNWYQHAAKIMPNGDLTLFDNGDNRNYTGGNAYSRAVEYRIDEQNMTVKQVWSYGESRGAETYSRIVSDVDYLPDDNHMIFSPGAINYGIDYGKVIELDYATKENLLEATITPPHAFYGITFHQTERMTLYPQ